MSRKIKFGRVEYTPIDWRYEWEANKWLILLTGAMWIPIIVGYLTGQIH